MEVEIGDILRYEEDKSDRYAVIMVVDYIWDDDYHVLVLDTNMKHVDRPWSLDPYVISMCTKLA